jgi:hypothetical protein
MSRAPSFICSLTYELGGDTSEQAKKLLRAELVGRGYKDRLKERALPRNAVWTLRPLGENETADDLHDKCTRDLRLASMSVRANGHPITILRAWIHVSGGGTYGLAGEDAFRDSPPGGDATKGPD